MRIILYAVNAVSSLVFWFQLQSQDPRWMAGLVQRGYLIVRGSQENSVTGLLVGYALLT